MGDSFASDEYDDPDWDEEIEEEMQQDDAEACAGSERAEPPKGGRAAAGRRTDKGPERAYKDASGDANKPLRAGLRAIIADIHLENKSSSGQAVATRLELPTMGRTVPARSAPRPAPRPRADTRVRACHTRLLTAPPCGSWPKPRPRCSRPSPTETVRSPPAWRGPTSTCTE